MTGTEKAAATPVLDLRVVEIGTGVAVRYCGYLLARLGSRVHRVVEEQATGSSSAQAARELFYDRGKKVTVGPAAEALPTLLTDADVLITDRELEDLGLDERVLAAEHPRLIVATGTVLGRHGRYRSLVGGDVQALALGGLMSMIGERDAEPLRLGGSQAELSAGLALFSGVFFALYGRLRTGRAAAVETSGVRAVAALDWKSHIYFVDSGRVLQRGSDSGPVVLRCADGFVGFYYRDEEWSAVKEMIGDPRLDDPVLADQLGRDRSRVRLVEIMNDWSGSRTRREVYSTSQDRHIPAGSVVNLDELGSDPQVSARGFLARQMVSGEKEIVYPRAPWTIDGARTEFA